MPNYQYRCAQCGHELEELQSITAAPLTRCPACQKDSLARVMGTGVGLIFKGSGFYLTDYKKPAQLRGPKPDEKAPSKPADSTKSETPKSPAAGSNDKK